ncbi:hypothetical protein Tco_0432253 [Tanacetum coccineum]
MFAVIKTRFGGNEATKKTQKTLLKQQYENFSALSSESLDSIFNRLQKIVSRLAILGVVIAQEDLNSKILSSLPPEWNTHVVVWMNKPEIETMSIDDFYNNFKIIKQKVKKTVGANSGAQNLAFMTAQSTSSTNDANTASPQVSIASPNVNTASSKLIKFMNANDTAGYDKSKDSKKESNVVCDKKSDDSKENSDNSLVKEQVSKDTSSFVESSLNVDKETVFPVDKKVESVKPKNHEKPVKKSVRYAEMYRSQTPRRNQRNWNGQKSNQLGSDFVMYNKACFICGSFNHVQAQCKYHQRERMVYGSNYNRVNYNYTTKRTHPNAQRNMVPRAVLMKTGLKTFNTARTVNTAHPKSIVFSAKPMSCFPKTAQSTVRRPFQSKTTLSNKRFTHKVNTAKAQVVNASRPQAINTARPKIVKTVRLNSAVVNAVRVN